MSYMIPGGTDMDITSCPMCWGTNLDPTELGPEHVAVICHDCGQVFEVKGAGSIADGEKPHETR